MFLLDCHSQGAFRQNNVCDNGLLNHVLVPLMLKRKCLCRENGQETDLICVLGISVETIVAREFHGNLIEPKYRACRLSPCRARPCTHKPSGVMRRTQCPHCPYSGRVRAAAQYVAIGQKQTSQLALLFHKEIPTSKAE